MPRRRTDTEDRISLGVVPVRDGEDVLGDSASALAGLATWLAVSPLPPAAIHTPTDVQRIGAVAAVRYVLHGWTERARGRLRLTMELNETQSGRLLWSDRLDRPQTERSALHADAALWMARAVPLVLFRRETERAALEPPDALTAQDLALRAFGVIMQPRRGPFAAAASVLAEAETKFGRQYGVRFALVWWHLMALSQGWRGDLPTVGEIASRLDRDDPAAMAVLAHLESVLRHDHAAAAAMLDRVLDGTPLCGMAASLKALTLCWLDQAQDAVAYAEKACVMPALGPEQAWRDHVTAVACYAAGQYSDAVRWARISATHHPGLAANVRVLAASLVVLGRLDDAQQAAAQVQVIDPRFRIEMWRERSLLPDECRDALARRLRLAGLPG